MGDIADKFAEHAAKEGFELTGETMVTGTVESTDKPDGKSSTQELLDKAVRGEFDTKAAPKGETPSESESGPSSPKEPPADPPGHSANLPTAPEAPDIIGYAKTAYPNEAGIFGRYQNADSLLQAFAEQRRALSQRDNDAEWARRARENPKLFLEGLRQARPDLFQSSPQAPATDTKPGDSPKAKAGFKPAEIAKFLRPDAPEELLRHLEHQHQNEIIEEAPVVQQLRGEIQKLQEQLQTTSGQFAKPEDIDSRIQFEQARGRDLALAADYVANNRNAIYVNGDLNQGYTAVGQRFHQLTELFERPREQGGYGLTTADALQFAENQIRREFAAKPQDPRPNGDAAVQRAQHGKQTTTPAEVKRREGESISDHFARQWPGELTS